MKRQSIISLFDIANGLFGIDTNNQHFLTLNTNIKCFEFHLHIGDGYYEVLEIDYSGCQLDTAFYLATNEIQVRYNMLIPS